MSRIIGIDLGTTNSCVAIFEDGEVVVLPNAEGSRTTPSVVAFTESGERLVGQQAKRQAVINPERTLFGTKRMMGVKFRGPRVVELQAVLPYRLVEAVNGDAWVGVGSQNYSPPEIAAMILQKMKATAEDYFGEPIQEAVVTVPAYFDDAQRQATKDAGRIAGLTIRRIINEPTAAALAYGFGRRREATLAVFDLGGGTFDISLLRLADGVFEVIATCGNNMLGGDDFDRAILQRLLQVFEDQTGIDISADKMALQRLREASEAAKCELSTLSETNINLPFLAVDASGPRHLSYQLTRSELNELVAPLIDRLEEPCLTAVRDAGLTTDQVDEVLLVGGMTRMPLVRDRVEAIFHRRPNKNINPDEAVAMGAAIQSSILDGELREVVLLDVTPLNLGIRVVGNRMSTIIEKNSPLPAQGKKVFTTTEDNQQIVSITVLQGESTQASENRILGTFNLGDIAQGPRGKARIEVTFDIDTDGIVHVSARDVETGAAHTITVTDHGGLTEEEVRRATDRANLHSVRERAK
jgi:molecular chaperone DnaK